MHLLEIKIFFFSALFLFFLGRFSPLNKWIVSARKWPFLTLVFILLFVSLFLSGGEASGLSVDTLDNSRFLKIGLLIGLAGISWCEIVLRGVHLKENGLGLAVMLLFSIVAMISSIYSSNKLLSFWKGFEVFASILVFLFFSSYIQKLEDIENFLNILWLILFFLVITALVGGVLDPHHAFVKQKYGVGAQAFEYWGIFPRLNPNSLAQLGTIVGGVGLVTARYSKRHKDAVCALAIASFGLIALILSHSRTSLFSFLIVTIFIFFCGRRKISSFILFVFSLVIITTFGGGKLITEYVMRGQSSELFFSMSGRTYFWDYVWHAIKVSPIFGHGYYAGHRQLNLGRIQLECSSVDNTYLEVLVDLGVVGLTILLTALITVAWSLYKYRPSVIEKELRSMWDSIWLLLLVLIFPIFIRSLTGPTFQVHHFNLFLFLILIICSAKVVRIFYLKKCL
ncbi:MAG: hypothetical protein DCC43_15010 [Candidatus Brocadia sp.]|nr:hypothetical protein [Anaerolineales bacterium]RIJ90076.1 MAG: hypothetical protein DCC43_15010 [Candidatus Brocadia sp.]